MFCPKCGMKNTDDAKFCRACGANISLVPQALEGKLPDANVLEASEWWKDLIAPPSIEKGVREIFTGIGFLLIAFAVLLFAPGGSMWWFWMLIPAFALLGGGIGRIVRVRRDKALRARLNVGAPLRQVPGAQNSSSASVTEGTTKLLDERQRGASTVRFAEQLTGREKS